MNNKDTKCIAEAYETIHSEPSRKMLDVVHAMIKPLNDKYRVPGELLKPNDPEYVGEFWDAIETRSPSVIWSRTGGGRYKDWSYITPAFEADRSKAANKLGIQAIKELTELIKSKGKLIKVTGTNREFKDTYVIGDILFRPIWEDHIEFASKGRLKNTRIWATEKT